MGKALITREEYLSSRFVSRPLRVLDCAFPVNGAVAILITSRSLAEERGADYVSILGVGEHHRPVGWRKNQDFNGSEAAALAAQQAFERSGLTQGDISLVEIYDPFTFVAPLQLERYGFCEANQGLELYRSGATAFGGSLPVNTGGGQTSGHYLQGFTPLLEAIEQIRGLAGDRQVAGVQTAFVGLCGGLLEHNVCLLLGRDSDTRGPES
jgi:acetyl-CoA acetyltransferase